MAGTANERRSPAQALGPYGEVQAVQIGRAEVNLRRGSVLRDPVESPRPRSPGHRVDRARETPRHTPWFASADDREVSAGGKGTCSG